MRTMNLFTIGFLSMIAATAALASYSFAAHPDRVDFISTLNENVMQLDSAKATDGTAMRVDVIDRIEPAGPSYPYLEPMNR
ncbi:MAG TPA: hypothetical protein VD738_05810 [Nitrospira sp.]|jgi:hypothetical protein|nr:hypothetical protein [Nitrospira sp.]